jgi:hypothetical protein
MPLPNSGPNEALWHAVLADWDNPKVHELLLSQSVNAAQLAALAGRYRLLLDEPTRRVVAEVQLKKIAAAAMARMDVQVSSPRPEARGRAPFLVLLVFLFVLGTVALLRFL